MEDRILSLINSLFNFYNFYIVFSVIFFLFIFEKDKICNLGGNSIYQKLNNNWLRLHIWGRDKTVWQSMKGIKQSLLKATGYATVLLIVVMYIPFLNFLGIPIILFILFNLFFFTSYDWVLNHGKVVKSKFTGIVKIIMLTILLTLAFLLVGVYSSDLSFFNDLGQEIPKNFKQNLYTITLLSSIILLFFLTIGTYFSMWVIFGILPIFLILIFFVLIKLSKNYKFFRSILFKRLIYINFVISALIIPLLKI
jgi:hypothetical protein